MQFAEAAVHLRFAGVSVIGIALAACSFDASPTGAAPGSLEAGISPVLGTAGDAGSAQDAAQAAHSDGATSLTDSALPAPDAFGPDPGDSAVEDGSAPPDAAPPDASMPPDASGPFDAGRPDVPVTSPVHAGDYPDDPYGELYVPLPGVVAPDGSPRGYKLHVPPSFSMAVPAPVLFAFHGEGSSAALFASYGAELLALADDLGLVLVSPNGVQAQGGALGSWNGGACCGAAAVSAIDDVAFVRRVLAHVRTQLRVDFARTYALGFSGGAYLAQRLGCEAADVFSAVISVGGGIGTPALAAVSGLGNNGFASCAPSRAVSVFAVHGSEDSYVPLAAMTRAVGFWSAANTCNAVAVPSNPALATGASSCVSYTGCRENAQITACTVVGGGHCWFGSASCGTGNAPDPAQHIGRNSDDLATSAAVATFIASLRPRP